MESFKIVGEEDLEIGSHINIEVGDDENFINDKFYETLNSKIRQEVKRVINSETSLLHTNLNANGLKVINPECDFENKRNSSDLVNVLLDQIEFLKGELKSKDSIIKILINDRVSDKPLNSTCNKDNLNNNTSVNRDNETPFSYPKKSSKLSNPADNIYNIKTHNGFELLSTTPLTECNGHDFDESNSNFSNNTNSVNNTVHRKNYRSTTILGDSIIKDIKKHHIKKYIPKGDKIYVKTFPGASTDCMKDHVKPSLKFNPDLIILHTGVNDLRSNKSPNVIADEIINLASNIKTYSNDVVISGLVGRNDELNYKLQQVNDILFNQCTERNIYFINNSNIKREHLNRTMHLNQKGSSLLTNNFLACINV